MNTYRMNQPAAGFRHRSPITALLGPVGPLLAVAAIALLLSAMAVSSASAQDLTYGDPQPQLFVGESDSGDIQAALDDALLKADLFYLGMGFSDLRFTYKVLQTSGIHGGLFPLSTVLVQIVVNPQ